MPQSERGQRPGGPEGLLLIDKPAGWTSHDVVAKLRGLTRQRRIGHTGTLDPMATGLLVVCLGRATRLVEYLVGHSKRYRGAITLGVTTETDDADGEVMATRPAPAIAPADLAALERDFTGAIRQRPPAYSAVKIAGKRAYAVARAGKTVEIPEREVVITHLQLEREGERGLLIDVECGAGTYIRSIARDIGERLGCGAHLSALRRVRVGHFDVANALTLDAVATLVGSGNLEGVLFAPDEGVAAFDAAILGPQRALALVHGGALTLLDPPRREASPARLYSASGAFLGMGKVQEGGGIRALKVLASPSELVMSAADTKQG